MKGEGGALSFIKNATQKRSLLIFYETITGTNFNSTFSGFLLLNRLLPKCNDRNKNQNDLFHSENWTITPENWPILALFWS